MCLFAVLPDKEASVGGSAAEFSQETLRGDVKVSTWLYSLQGRS